MKTSPLHIQVNVHWPQLKMYLWIYIQSKSNSVPDHLFHIFQSEAKYWFTSEPFWRLCTWSFTYSKGNLDLCRSGSHSFSLLRGSGWEKPSHIPFLIICSRYWPLQDLTGIDISPLSLSSHLESVNRMEHYVYILSIYWIQIRWSLFMLGCRHNLFDSHLFIPNLDSCSLHIIYISINKYKW